MAYLQCGKKGSALAFDCMLDLCLNYTSLNNRFKGELKLYLKIGLLARKTRTASPPSTRRPFIFCKHWFKSLTCRKIVWFGALIYTFYIKNSTKSEQKVTGNWFCTPIIFFKNPLQNRFFNNNNYILITICVWRVWIVIRYFLFENRFLMVYLMLLVYKIILSF